VSVSPASTLVTPTLGLGTLGTAEPTSGATEESKPDCEIVSVDTRVTEANDVWSKYAWKLKLRNNRSASINVAATIQFRDAQSFVVDDTHATNLILGPNEEKTFTGYALINASSANSVKEVQATLRER